LCILANGGVLRAQVAAASDAHNPGFVENTFSTAMMAKFSLGVVYDQATEQVPKWGSGIAGLQKRAEWRMAGLVSRTSAEYGIARLRETDPGYVRCQCKGFGPRSRHVIVSEFTERRADGGLAAPVSRFGGIGASIAVTSIGQRSGPGDAAARGLLMVNTDIGFRLLEEFWPEIRRTLFFRRK
jgi:hypothetical protein